ncbi:uncharacterized protein G2W53_001082 [Senna tora]|uniref:Uncharacterized protein n=1 Tax=Senna tora TaxID=362788 RepID=A0A834XH52_9FABA|nr:uncharacterized protein G2W53_001082 [Senna tora]
MKKEATTAAPTMPPRMAVGPVRRLHFL